MRTLVTAFLAAIMMSACSPSLSPLYRDYEVPDGGEPVDARIVAALADAGWDTVDTDIPNAIVTSERVLSNWGIYRVTASLEVTPLGADHVRVFVHPYRRYIFGGKGKILYLTGPIRSRFMPELNDALKGQGLIVAGTPFERDRTKLR